MFFDRRACDHAAVLLRSGSDDVKASVRQAFTQETRGNDGLANEWMVKALADHYGIKLTDPPWFAESRHRWPDVCNPSEVTERVYQAWRDEMDRRREFRRESNE